MDARFVPGLSCLRVTITAAIVLVGIAPSAQGFAASGRTYVVCPAGSRAGGCQFNGDGGIPAAIDRAADGDTILIKAGRYAPVSFRDVKYKEITVRGYIVVDGKNLSIIGEAGTVLDGSAKLPATAIVVRRAEVSLRNLEITGFRYDIQEDDIYEGHGVFVIDGKARIDNVTIRRSQKMGLTGRGDSLLDASNLQVLDGHVGIWLHEFAYLRLRNSIIRGNDSSAIAAYDNSVAHVSNSVFDGNLDDGLYSEHQATIFATNSLVLRNKPAGIHAIDESRIWVGYSALFGNAANVASKDNAEVRLGPGVIESEPRLTSDYRLQPDSPLLGKGDPDLGDPAGSPSEIGPHWTQTKVR